MKLDRVRCTGFGSLGDLDTGDGVLPSLVVVVGPNEAGKTTFFELLVSLLYGFEPASRERHPYTPRDGRDIDIEAAIRSDGGETANVHRRLLSAPYGRLEWEGRSADLRNRPLPTLAHVDRGLYRNLYALTLADLAGLGGEAWNRIQDQLLGGMGARDLIPVRDVLRVLEQEAGALWRPSRRGNQRIRETRDRIHDALARRRQALDRDRQLRRLIRESAEASAERRRAREAREQGRLVVERARRLRPVRDQLRRIEELERRAGPPEILNELPEAPGRTLAEARATCKELTSRLAVLDDDEARLRASAGAYGEAERLLAAHDEEVRAVIAAVGALETDRTMAATLEQELRDLDRRMQTLGRELLSRSLADVAPHELLELRTAELRERVRTYSAAREARVQGELRAAAASGVPASGPVLLVDGVVALAGAGLAVWGGLTAQTPSLVAGLVLAAGALAHVWWTRRLAGGTGPAGADLDELGRNERAAAEAVGVLLGDLPLHEQLRSEPTHEVASSLSRLQELAGDVESRRASLAEIRIRAASADERVRALGSELALELPAEVTAAARFLDGALREAQAAGRQAASSGSELDRIAQRRSQVRTELEAARGRLCALEALLSDLGQGDLAAGLEEAEARLQDKERARQIREELERVHPDLDEIVRAVREAEQAEEEWALDSEALGRAAAELDELTDTIDTLGQRVVALDHEVARLEREPTVDRIDGELDALQEEVAWLTRARDRRIVLGRVLAEADRRFREEHQPDVFARAGGYLERITDGRYHRLGREERDGATRVLLYGPGLDDPLEVDDTTSTGTREQVYLALRLATVDHVDHDQERLPLLLDEVFVNWDAERRRRGLDLVAEIARVRQVFVCTCHEEWAAELEHMGARAVRLS